MVFYGRLIYSTLSIISRSRFLFAPHDDFFDFAISKSSSSSFGSVTKLTCCDEFSSSSEDSSFKGCCLCLPAASIAAMCVGLLAVREEKEVVNDDGEFCRRALVVLFAVCAKRASLVGIKY